ncbi:MAG: cytidylyltransferase domain-containing protein [Fusobacteriaceae bacterium]
MNEKILAIIPARSGSKGLLHKNIKELNGKPLIAYTIEAAKKSEIFQDIFVSTDSKEYAEISEKYGATIPFLREELLSGDTSKISDVIVDILDRLEKLGKKYDYFILLQPTSPLRDEDDIIKAYNLLKDKNANSVVSVCEADHSPLWMNNLDGSLSMDNFIKDLNKNRQELKKYYRINGAIYLSKVDYYKKNRNFYDNSSFAYIMLKQNSVDIDTLLDFKFAEYLIKDGITYEK